MKVRFRNHKSHIKTQRQNCEVSKHFAENPALFIMDKSTLHTYTNSLKEHLVVIIIEQVDVFHVGQIKKREWYWQNQLKTLKQYGSLNVREERSWIVNFPNVFGMYSSNHYFYFLISLHHTLLFFSPDYFKQYLFFRYIVYYNRDMNWIC